MLRAFLLQASPFGSLLVFSSSAHLQILPAASSSLAGSSSLVHQLHTQTPPPPLPHQQQQHYSTETAAPEAAALQQQDPNDAASSQPQEDQQHQQDLKLPGPILPTHILLKTIIESQQQPPTSHELFDKVKQEYAAVFPTRRQFKSHLQHIVRNHWVASKPNNPAKAAAAPAGAEASQPAAAAAAAAGGVKAKKAKGGAAPAFVYTPTKAGYKVDLCSTGAALTLAARKIADEWTAKRLQQYTQYLEAGVIPVDATNIQLLGADKGMALFRKQQQQEWERRQPKEQQPQPVEAAAAVGQQESQQQTQQQA